MIPECTVYSCANDMTNPFGWLKNSRGVFNSFHASGEKFENAVWLFRKNNEM